MKNIISKSVFTSLLVLCLASGFTVAYGQNPMYLTITNNTGLTVDHYVITWTVFSLSPYTTYPCDSYTATLTSPFSFPTPIYFFANVNDVKDPIFYVYVRAVGYNSLNKAIVGGDNYVGPMTTYQLQGSWSITVPVTNL